MGVGVSAAEAVGVRVTLLGCRSKVPTATGAEVAEAGRGRVGVLAGVIAADWSVLMGAGRVGLTGGTPVGMGIGAHATARRTKAAMHIPGAEIHFCTRITTLILAYACLHDKLQT